MADLLGVAGDVLARQPAANGPQDMQDALRVRDKILASVAGAARWTGAVLAMAEPPDDTVRAGRDRHRAGWARDLDQVLARADDGFTHHPADRAGAFDDLVAVSVEEPSLTGGLAHWCRTAEERLRTPGLSSRAVRDVAVGLALITAMSVRARAVAEDQGISPDAAAVRVPLAKASGTWRGPAAGWAIVRCGGAMPGLQAEAGRELRAYLTAVSAELRPGEPGACSPSGHGWQHVDVRAVLTILRGAMPDVTALADAYTRAAGRLVATEALVIPARVAARTQRPVPVAVVHVARRVEWVVLTAASLGRHPASPPAGHLLTTARTADADVATERARVRMWATAGAPVADAVAQLAPDPPEAPQLPSLPSLTRPEYRCANRSGLGGWCGTGVAAEPRDFPSIVDAEDASSLVDPSLAGRWTCPHRPSSSTTTKDTSHLEGDPHERGGVESPASGCRRPDGGSGIGPGAGRRLPAGQGRAVAHPRVPGRQADPDPDRAAAHAPGRVPDGDDRPAPGLPAAAGE